MENIHNTASLAAITAHHESRVTFTRSGIELFCEIVSPDLIKASIKKDGNFIVGEQAPAHAFDVLPVVRVFNSIPENDTYFPWVNFVKFHLIPEKK